MYVQINQPHYAVWTLPLQSRLFKTKCGRRRRAAYIARDHAGKLVKGEETSLRRALAMAESIVHSGGNMLYRYNRKNSDVTINQNLAGQ